MENIEKDPAKFITLKEASKISGYSPDYLGQLIRKGKLSGKQVYLNVAWMTTEGALREYLDNNKTLPGKATVIGGIRAKARRWLRDHTTGEAMIILARRVLYILIVILAIFCLFLIYALFANIFRAATVQAATGVPKILSYQGRLFDSGGNLLGGAGTAYCFRFSIFNASSAGSQLWPAATASIMTVNVANGVFNVGVGDTNAGGDALTYDFQSNDTLYLNVAVATKVDLLCSGASEVFENLLPRQRIVASGYAINSYSLGGFTPSQNATGSQIPVLNGGNLTLAGTSPQINATGTNSLTLQGDAGATGSIQFFSANNFLSSAGALRLASTVAATQLQSTATSSQFIFGGTGASGTLSWNPTIAEALTIPNFGTSSDTVALVNFAQTFNNKTLAAAILNSGVINSSTINTSTFNSPSVFGGMTILQNAAGTGLLLTQNSTGTALAIVNAPSSAQTTSTVSIFSGTNVAGTALLVQNFGSGNALQINDASSVVLTVDSNGNTLIQPSNDTSTVFIVNNASGTNTLFAVDTLNNKVKIGDNGAPGSVPTLFGLDTKADAGDPTGFNGAMYYSSSSGAFRCYQGSVWANCVPTNLQWQPAFLLSRWGFWAPPNNTAATTFSSTNLVAPTVNGTAAASAQAEDYYVQYTSANAGGNIAGLTGPLTQTEPRYTTRLATRIRTDSVVTNRRIWVALNSAALTGSDEAAGASAVIFVGLRYSTNAGDTTWQCGSGDGTTISYVNTGVTVATSTYYDIVIDGSVLGQIDCEIATNGGSYVNTLKATNIPTSTTALGITNAATNIANGTIIHRISYVYLGGAN
jgi:hypothetical protein